MSRRRPAPAQCPFRSLDHFIGDGHQECGEQAKSSCSPKRFTASIVRYSTAYRVRQKCLPRRQAAERTMRLAEQHVAQQEQRIEQQKNLISSLEVDGHWNWREPRVTC